MPSAVLPAIAVTVATPGSVRMKAVRRWLKRWTERAGIASLTFNRHRRSRRRADAHVPCAPWVGYDTETHATIAVALPVSSVARCAEIELALQATAHTPLDGTIVDFYQSTVKAGRGWDTGARQFRSAGTGNRFDAAALFQRCAKARKRPYIKREDARSVTANPGDSRLFLLNIRRGHDAIADVLNMKRFGALLFGDDLEKRDKYVKNFARFIVEEHDKTEKVVGPFPATTSYEDRCHADQYFGWHLVE